MQLRPYQRNIINEIYKAWEDGAKNVCVQLATGAGKTVIFSNIIANHQGASIAVAHRSELLGQISLTLSRNRIQHNIVAQKSTVKEIIKLHYLELGASYYNPQALCFVASVDTLVRKPPDIPWFSRITLVVQDEGHHLLRSNKWGDAAALFPNARGLYPTATPVRADGRGLGRHADGLMDELIQGISMRELIQMGYLTDYRIFAPPSDLDLTTVTITPTGDYSPPKLRSAVDKSSITGDIVEQYLKIAAGKLGVTFAVGIESARKIAEKFNESGVKAEIITGTHSELERAAIMRRFRNRETLQLVNVDLLGEGMDVPGIEVVSMARPTKSYGLYVQQFGRALRPANGKTHAIIIDHVSNVMTHGLPDAPRSWSLGRRDKRSRGQSTNIKPIRVCVNCTLVYPLTAKRECPYCGHYTPPNSRSSVASVDGDLFELDSSILAQLRGEIARIDDTPRIPKNLSSIAQRAVFKRHNERRRTQNDLRDMIALYAGVLKHRGYSDHEIYREFYLTFNIDVLTAQTLNVDAANELRQKIQDTIDTLLD